MADYRGIQGVAVQSRTSSTGLLEGEIWYDSSAGKFKLQGLSVAAWATSGALPQAGDTRVGLGIQTAALCIGRQNQGYQTFNNSDIYN